MPTLSQGRAGGLSMQDQHLQIRAAPAPTDSRKQHQHEALLLTCVIDQEVTAILHK